MAHSVKGMIKGTRSEATLSGWEEGARLMGQLVKGPETGKVLSDKIGQDCGVRRRSGAQSEQG